ncbi:MAG: hypothetical protein ABJE95_13265 [Byssovorax sp.]
MTRAWYIDAYDVRGGYTFASLRDPDLLAASRLRTNPSVFLSPPFFRPEPVINAGMAAGATRHGSQEGLFLDGGEVPFKTTDALAEFVRRAYLASASDGGGGDQEPPPEPPEPLLPPENLGNLLESVNVAVSHFASVVAEQQTVGNSAHFDWFEDKECRPQDLSRLAAYGMNCVLRVLATRFERNDPHGFLWRDFLLVDTPFFPTAIIALRCERALRNLFGPVQVVEPWNQFLNEPHIFPLISIELGNPVDVLVRLPLAPSVSRALGLRAQSATVYDLLLRVMASPVILLAEADANRRAEIVSLVFLAGSLIVSAQGGSNGDVGVTSDGLESSARLASRWLQKQLPSRAFHETVECLIAMKGR